MLDVNKIKKAIINDSAQLLEPQDYFKGVGKPGSTIDNILLMRRCLGFPINTKKNAIDEFCHRRYVLTINLHTDGIACVNEKPLTLPEDCGFLIYPYQTHHYIVDQDDFFWLVFTFESFEAYPANLMYRIAPLSADSYFLVWKLLKIYLSLQDEKTDINNELLSKYLDCLLIELQSTSKKSTPKLHADRKENQQLQLFEKINGYILRYLNDPELSVQAVADQHYVSVSFLHSLFDSMVKQTPGEYIRFIRLDRAKKLLSHSNITIAEIAEKCGFSSPSVFSRCFHREMQLTPKQYMAMIKQQMK
jgi:AraC-like DNA-binding protein